jgi:mono/diheme cytochrome c family protein
MIQKILQNKRTQSFSWKSVVILSFLFIFVAPSFLWAGNCPQPRNTKKAPSNIYKKVNPLDPSIENILVGKGLYEEKAKPLACKFCHGMKGDGRGSMSLGLNPLPRNFTCAKTINDVPDGQLFWIIRNGSPGTGMPAFKKLEDEEIWQIILYLRKLAQSRIVEVQIIPLELDPSVN